MDRDASQPPRAGTTRARPSPPRENETTDRAGGQRSPSLSRGSVPHDPPSCATKSALLGLHSLWPVCSRRPTQSFVVSNPTRLLWSALRVSLGPRLRQVLVRENTWLCSWVSLGIRPKEVKCLAHRLSHRSGLLPGGSDTPEPHPQSCHSGNWTEATWLGMPVLGKDPDTRFPWVEMKCRCLAGLRPPTQM